MGCKGMPATCCFSGGSGGGGGGGGGVVPQRLAGQHGSLLVTHSS